jgi:hypothetical protein
MTAAVLAIVAPAGAATNVVTCTPTAGLSSVAKISKPAVLPPSEAAYGLKLSTTIDGCVANTTQLSNWVASKNGTADGGSIAKAALSLSTKAYGNCGFNIFFPDPSQYPATGTLKVKWLDSSGVLIKSAKPSSAYVKIGFDTNFFSSTLDGIVTKGLGVGADVHASSTLDLANPNNTNFLGCLFGSPFQPVAEIDLVTSGSDALTIGFP